MSGYEAVVYLVLIGAIPLASLGIGLIAWQMKEKYCPRT